MSPDRIEAPADPLIVAISSRTLFDLEEGHDLFEREGLEAYAHYQRGRENDVLAPGVAFPLVRKLLGLKSDDKPAQPAGRLVTPARTTPTTDKKPPLPAPPTPEPEHTT